MAGAVPPVVVEATPSAPDNGPVAIVDLTHSPAARTSRPCRLEVCLSAGGEVVIDQPGSCLAAAVDVVTQPPADSRRGDAEAASKVSRRCPLWHHAILAGPTFRPSTGR